MNSSELWYSTVSHDVKHKISVIDSNYQTEYAVTSVPEGKANVTSPEEHSEYDDVLVTEKVFFCLCAAIMSIPLLLGLQTNTSLVTKLTH